MTITRAPARPFRTAAVSLACLLAPALAPALVLPGCKNAPSVTESAGMVNQLFGKWDLTSITGVDLSKLSAMGLKMPSLDFAGDGKVSGFSGVNQLASSLDLKSLASGKFQLAPTATTRMAGPPAANDLETSFIGALAKADSFKVAGDQLTLSKGAEQLMGFVRHK